MHVLPRLRERDARLEAALYCEIAQVASGSSIGRHSRLDRRHDRQRDIEGGMQIVIDAGEASWGDADHCEIDGADTKVTIDDRRIASESLLPFVVVEHDHRVSSGHLILV